MPTISVWDRHSCWVSWVKTTNGLRYFSFPPVTARDKVTWEIWLCPALKSLLVELIPKETEVGFQMAKEEPPSISKDLQELQRKLSLLIDSVQNNSKVSFQSTYHGKSQSNTSLNTTESYFSSERYLEVGQESFSLNHFAMSELCPSNSLSKMVARASAIVSTFQEEKDSRATSNLRRLPGSHTCTKLPVTSHRLKFSLMIILCSKYNSLAGNRGNSQSVP